jgi:hypothetical protein
VNPTLLTLARQRRGIDCGGLDYLVVAYGTFVQLVMAIDGGHVSFAIERSESPTDLVEQRAGPRRDWRNDWRNSAYSSVAPHSYLSTL